jgi:hypothetical protein
VLRPAAGRELMLLAGRRAARSQRTRDDRSLATSQGAFDGQKD